jgi:hypothetical protein
LPQELTSAQVAALERLVTGGFQLIAFPLYASMIGVRRGEFAALIEPVNEGGLRLFNQPCCLIQGNLSVRIQSDGKSYFVWKRNRVEATDGLLARLDQFKQDLQCAINPVS